MAEEEYTRLLEKAISQLPSQVSKKDRFRLPWPESTVMGSRTVLYNLKEICDVLRRREERLLRYLSKELATAGNSDGTRVVFQGRFSNETISRLIKRYTQDFVYCPVCNQPDTRIMKQDRYEFLICEACGAKSPLES